MIQLGGNITLEGFQGRDYAELIVVKKIVGRYARQISDAQDSFQELRVTLLPGDACNVTAACKLQEAEHEASSSQQNLFVAMDEALKQLIEKL